MHKWTISIHCCVTYCRREATQYYLVFDELSARCKYHADILTAIQKIPPSEICFTSISKDEYLLLEMISK